MLKNYFKIALRTLNKNRALSLINIFSLSIGLTVCILIALFVNDELSYDKTHENGERIYRVLETEFDEEGNIKWAGPQGEIPLGPTLGDEFPQIEAWTRLNSFEAYTVCGTQKFKDQVMEADPGILKMLSLNFLAGNPNEALKNPNSVVFTRTMAEKYFGLANPLNEQIKIRIGDQFETFMVTALVEDIPDNSTIDFDICIPFVQMKKQFSWAEKYWDSWQLSGFPSYVMLGEGQSIPSQSLTDFYMKYHERDINSMREDGIIGEDELPNYSYTLQNLYDIHLNTEVEGGMSESSDPMYSYILMGIALFILIIACVNYINLNLARSASRSVEVGVRKVVGARRRQIIGQFLGESILITLISFLIALALSEATLGVFNELTNKTLSHYDFLDPLLLGILLIVVILTGFLSGIYPSLFLSNVNVQNIMKRSFRIGGNNLVTQTLVGVQFLLAAGLLSITLIMSKQLNFMQNADLGYNGDQVVSLTINQDDLKKLKTKLATNPNIVDVSGVSHRLGRGRINTSFEYDLEGQKNSNVFIVEPSFISLMEIELLQGRDFDPNSKSDSARSIIVNKAFVDEFMSDKNPLEESIGLEGFGIEKANIIGVVDNFVYASVGDDIEPAFLTLSKEMSTRSAVIKVNGNNIKQAVSDIETIWYEMFPNILFEFGFMDQYMAKLYEREQRWSSIVNYATIFTILISAMGLFGMAAITLVNRSKEIGIRKVLGADFSHILKLLLSQFSKPIVIAIVLAIPASLYFSNRWLENYSNRVDPGFDSFLITGILILSISAFTIAYYAFRGSKINPIEALRTE